MVFTSRLRKSTKIFTKICLPCSFINNYRCLIYASYPALISFAKGFPKIIKVYPFFYFQEAHDHKNEKGTNNGQNKQNQRHTKN